MSDFACPYCDYKYTGVFYIETTLDIKNTSVCIVEDGGDVNLICDHCGKEFIVDTFIKYYSRKKETTVTCAETLTSFK